MFKLFKEKSMFGIYSNHQGFSNNEVLKSITFKIDSNNTANRKNEGNHHHNEWKSSETAVHFCQILNVENQLKFWLQ